MLRLHLGPRLISQLKCENTKLPLPLLQVVTAAVPQNQDGLSDQEIFPNTSQLPGVFFLPFSYTLATEDNPPAGFFL